MPVRPKPLKPKPCRCEQPIGINGDDELPLRCLKCGRVLAREIEVVV